jgi:hypothetical protein
VTGLNLGRFTTVVVERNHDVHDCIMDCCRDFLRRLVIHDIRDRRQLERIIRVICGSFVRTGSGWQHF